MDALRGEDERERADTETERSAAPTETEATERTLVQARADLQAAGVPAGVLTYADEDCRLHYVTLPDLGPHPGPDGRSCSFDSTVGDELVFGGQPPDPFGGGLVLRCRRGEVQLRMPKAGLYARAPGACGIAWRPDRTPTFLQSGEVMQFAPCSGEELGALPISCSRTLLSRDDLRREFRRARWTRFDFRVQEIHWLSNRRFAAIVNAGSVAAPARICSRSSKVAVSSRARPSPTKTSTASGRARAWSSSRRGSKTGSLSSTGAGGPCASP